MGPDTSSFGLIDRIKRGEREALSPLFEKVRARLAVLIHYKASPQLLESVEVDDIVQETFLRAFKEFDQFTYQSPGSFLRWLSSIAEHVVIDLARFHGREKRRPAEVLSFRSPSNPGGPEPLDTTTPSRVFAESENLRLLLRKLDALPENYRQAILLAKVEGLTTEELAQRLGKSREAAALLLHRAIKRFRQIQERSESQ